MRSGSARPRRGHHGPSGWRYWLYTTDHKVIGIIYLWHALVAFALGGLLALVFRTELAINPDNVMLQSLSVTTRRCRSTA